MSPKGAQWLYRAGFMTVVAKLGQWFEYNLCLTYYLYSTPATS